MIVVQLVFACDPLLFLLETTSHLAITGRSSSFESLKVEKFKFSAELDWLVIKLQSVLRLNKDHYPPLRNQELSLLDLLRV